MRRLIAKLATIRTPMKPFKWIKMTQTWNLLIQKLKLKFMAIQMLSILRRFS